MEKKLEAIWSQFTQPEEYYLPYPILILRQEDKKEEILRQSQDEAKIGIKQLVQVNPLNSLTRWNTYLSNILHC